MAKKDFLLLWGKLRHSESWKEGTPEAKVVMVTLMLMANDTWQWVEGGKKRKTKAGQVHCSVAEICDWAGKGITRQKARTALKWLELTSFLTNDSTNQGSLISIMNWDTYQMMTTKSNQGSNQRSNQRKKPAKPRVVGLPIWQWWIDCHDELKIKRPVKNPPDLGQVKTLSRVCEEEKWGEAEMKEIMKSYLNDGDMWLIKQGHALRYMGQRINAYVKKGMANGTTGDVGRTIDKLRERERKIKESMSK